MRPARPVPSLLPIACLAVLAACNGMGNAPRVDAQAAPAPPATVDNDGKPFTTTEFARFDAPWAMTFLPDGRLLVTEKPGALNLFDPASRRVHRIAGVPTVDHGGQGGLGDVVLHPRFADNGLVYLSYAEQGDGDTRGAAVARGRLTLDPNGGGALSDVQVIWRQVPKVDGRGHYGHRIAFSPDGRHVFISSGDRQKFTPAQDMASNLGKILRLNDDGSVPVDNPFAGKGDAVAAQVWTLGHRNPMGIAFDARGRLWNHEMGPKGGDEINLVVRGDNYGYPVVSNGDHYDGTPIPDHHTRPDFHPPAASWTPVISPAGLVFYSGTLFPDWQGDALAGGLSAQALVRIRFKGERAWEAARYDMGRRIREVEQGPDGAVWLLEDGDGGRLLKLTPVG